MSGFYLGLEGVEGAGKSTVAGLLKQAITDEGREVLTVREPGGTTLGERVRELLLHGDEMEPWAEAALFAAQRAQLAAEVLAPALARGAFVISDRTYYSSLAYQGAGRGLGIERVRHLNEMALEGLEPHLVVVLDVDPEVGLGRQHDPDRIGSSGVAFQAAVAAAYRGLAEAEPERVVLVDASRPPLEVAKEVLVLVEARWRR